MPKEENKPVLNVDLSFDIYNPEVLTFIKERSMDFWKTVSKTTKDKLRTLMQRATEEGHSTDQVVNNIRASVFGDLPDSEEFTRARLIARTETTIALNQGADFAYQQAQEQGVEMGKSWLTSGDEDVRKSHAKCGAQGVIKYERPFSNGLMFPGDPGGDVSELANCRCSLLPEVKQVPQRLSTGDTAKVTGVANPLPFCGKSLAISTKKGAGTCVTKSDVNKVLKAKESYKPATAEVQRIGEANELRLAEAIKGLNLEDNEPFDVIVKGSEYKHLVEVKTIVRGENDKITMHPESLRRKIKELENTKNGKVHTVVFDERVKKVYYKEGLGSFRLKNMEEVSIKKLKKVFV